MTALQDFLSALFAACPESPVPLTVGEDVYEAYSADEIAGVVGAAEEAGEALYTAPITQGLVAFLPAVTENVADPDEWRDATIQPTAVLFRDGIMLSLYALDAAVDLEATPEVQNLFGWMGSDPSDLIPIPDANGWSLVHCDPNVYQTLATLLDAYAPETPVAGAVGAPAEGAPWDEDFGTLNDAHILAYYDPSDAYYAQEMTISIGGNRESKKWVPKTMPIASFVELLSMHREDPKKDGLAFVLAEIVGDQRRKQAVKTCYGVGLDIDVGVSGAQIDAALKEMGCLAVRYTTHSHNKTSTFLNKDRVTKWAAKNGQEELDEESIKRFLREEEDWVPELIETVAYLGDDHRPEGLMIQLEHDPMPKHRVVVPLATPYEVAKIAKTHEEGMRKWNEIPKALARALGDLPLDKAALDPSRLFYFPRHAPGRAHETTIFGGPMLDWATLDLDGAPKDAFEAALEAEISGSNKSGGGSRSTTKEGRDLGRWSIKRAHGFQIVDVIRDYDPDRIRTNGANKIDIECPFDDHHSNPGDPEDKGCFAVNAGDGPSGIFTIKCQHDSCHERTNLDFLGKMLKDGWFEDSVLESDMYNAILDEDDKNIPEAAIKIAAQDDARDEYQVKISALSPESSESDIEDALRALMEADLGPLAQQRAESEIKQNLKINQSTLTRMLKTMRRVVERDRNQSGDYRDPKGRLVFSFQGDFNFDEAVDMCFKALRNTNTKDAEPTFSCVQDKPVRLKRNPKSGRIAFEELPNQAMWSELNTRLTFVKRGDNGDGARQAVPKEVATHVYEQVYNELPQSPEVIYTPLYTNDGALVLHPGYYADLNILMANTRFEIDVPVNPSAEDALAAVDFLKNELLVDFPFLDYDTQGNERREPSEANALAMLLTPFMRRMINGCTPVFFVAKPTPGTGGTLLGKVPMLIFDGAEGAPMGYTQNEEEMRKSLLAAIIETRSHLFFDDVREFNNRVLLQSITAQEIGGRLLGSTRNVTRPNTFNWVGTGNNPLIGSEMERRICWIRLNRKTSNIQEITYTHDDLPGWIADNRAKIIRAILTMIQYWIDIGQPTFTERKRVSFEDWSRKVGGVLQACAVEGFLDNRRSAGADMDETAIRTFVKEWLKKFGFEKTAPAKLFEYATSMELDIIEGNNDDQKKQRFPKRLHTLDGRVFSIDSVDYIVLTNFDDDNNLVYSLTPLETAQEAEAA
ncbi:PE-PGRS family protein [Caulobacter phage CcrPW]|uniref:PE-PGRS family protein n=1 Tax=Caulobacter phage CcrPW TaxID=2283271 RepID=A0A385ECZ0_9CAUD|nr:PE-PGRS family protein [Caulobacter phage CcrPW]AXQ68732.1 PE-PGRS family protein [Caulobacter phage CcrPW]